MKVKNYCNDITYWFEFCISNLDMEGSIDSDQSTRFLEILPHILILIFVMSFLLILVDVQTASGIHSPLKITILTIRCNRSFVHMA